MEAYYEQEASQYEMKLPTLFYSLLKDRQEAIMGKGNGLWFPRNMQTTTPTIQSTEIGDGEIKTPPDTMFQAFGGLDE